MAGRWGSVAAGVPGSLVGVGSAGPQLSEVLTVTFDLTVLGTLAVAIGVALAFSIRATRRTRDAEAEPPHRAWPIALIVGGLLLVGAGAVSPLLTS